ncbi:MAG TPA: hypothetical protein VLL54_07720 [Pyrinomonadaceae bacterium]|nr:hypothetical protein [Pyrinomonadaceae bacterium]
MLSKLKISLFCLGLFLGANAAVVSAKRSLVERGNHASPIATKDVCSLLDQSAIAAVQGTAVQQAQATGNDSGDLNISQCYYMAISEAGKNLSVHLQVIQRNAKSLRPDAVNEFWEARFEREESKRESAERRGERREEEEEGIKPVAVRGIGNEAFWVKSGRAGTLFVKSNREIFRLSLGGSETEREKLEKSKTLARQLLARLR